MVLVPEKDVAAGRCLPSIRDLVGRHRLDVDIVIRRGVSRKAAQHQILVQEKGVTLDQALTTALRLEESLIEKRFFEVFDSDSPELKEVFQDLSRETEAHIEKIKHMQ